ncbi:uncharacterized protein LOC113147126 [Cyclospora cayetanensis]|uniref:Uncharacterized protein LOC113147126 n=1 Tax=Cyclospora cayetanensis TaxID=88456 RepID=A0A6P6RWR5_9EIME|nr:uncharacterized protein LOC113147126 [Cyclospora cayetanensis]
MCAILGACCGNASKACHCLSLRNFAFIWLGINILLAAVQFIAGSSLAAYRAPVDSLLQSIREKIMEMDNPTTALKYYNVIANSLAVLWKGTNLLTTVRGVYDSIAIGLWVYGWYYAKIGLVYIFVGMTALAFFVDFCLLIIFLVVINVLYVAYFFPSALALPFIFFGWQAFLGPYILHLLLSHAFVLSVGGDGTEMKTWKEVQKLKEKAARQGTKTSFTFSVNHSCNALEETLEEKVTLLEEPNEIDRSESAKAVHVEEAATPRITQEAEVPDVEKEATMV